MNAPTSPVADGGPAFAACPFCGASTAWLLLPTCNQRTPYNPNDRAYPIVRCGCGAEVSGNDWDHSGESAAKVWNRRATQPGETEA